MSDTDTDEHNSRVLPPIFPCGMCGGRGVNSNGSDCEYCDCGMADADNDIIAAKEIGYDPHFAARMP